MILHVFECSGCQYEQKHVTSTPTPLGLSYMSECIQCKKIQTFSFVREGNRKEDWYSNILIQVNRKRAGDLSNKARRKSDQSDDGEQSDKVAI
jgi:hypothetical protein